MQEINSQPERFSNQNFTNPNINLQTQNNPLISPPKRFSGKILSIIGASAGLIVVLLLILVGSALAGRLWDPEWNPFRPNPDKVINQAFLNVQKIKTLHTESNIALDILGPQNVKISIISVGDSDLGDLANQKSAGKINFSTLTDNSEYKASFKADYKIINEDFYFNIADFDAPSLKSLLLNLGINVDRVIGNWIKFPENSQLQNVGSNQDSEILIEKVKKIFLENKIYALKKKLPDQIINGQKIYHYLVVLDNVKLSKAVGDIIEESLKNNNQLQQRISPLFVGGEIKGIVSEFLDKMGEINVDLGIGSKDNYIYVFKMEKKIDLNAILKNEKGTVDLNISVNNSKFNQPVVIETPADFMKLEDILPITPILGPKK